jgi:hypothetical protein
MSTPDPAKTTVLTSVPTEFLASLLVDRLRSEGIEAEMSGGLTSDFRIGAPEEVQVLVHAKDAAHAGKVLAAWHKDRG